MTLTSNTDTDTNSSAETYKVTDLGIINYSFTQERSFVVYYCKLRAFRLLT